MADSQDNKGSLEGLFAKLGLSSEFMQKAHFKGPVGKLTLLAIVCCLALGSIGMRTNNPIVAGVCAGSVLIVALSIGGGILWYSNKFPELATLEGAEVVVWRREITMAAAQGITPPPNAPLLPEGPKGEGK